MSRRGRPDAVLLLSFVRQARHDALELLRRELPVMLLQQLIERDRAPSSSSNGLSAAIRPAMPTIDAAAPFKNVRRVIGL